MARGIDDRRVRHLRQEVMLKHMLVGCHQEVSEVKVLSRLNLCVVIVVAMFVAVACSSTQERDDGAGEDLVVSPKGEAEEDEPHQAATSLEEHLREVASRLESDEDYEVLFSQDGRLIVEEDYRFVVEARPFEIHVVTTVDAPAAVNIYGDSRALEAFRRGDPIPPELGAPGTGMAERPFNEDQQIFIDPQGLNMWVYRDEDDHRFDDVVEVEGRIVGTRRVAECYDPLTGGSTPVEEAAGMELHFMEFGPSGEDGTREPVGAYTLEIY